MFIIIGSDWCECLEELLWECGLDWNTVGEISWLW